MTTSGSFVGVYCAIAAKPSCQIIYIFDPMMRVILLIVIMLLVIYCKDKTVCHLCHVMFRYVGSYEGRQSEVEVSQVIV